MTTYFSVLTRVGEAKIANAIALGTPLRLTQLGVGDGNGVLPTPDRLQTSLVHEVRRADINQLSIDPNNPSQIILEQVLPESVGGWWIRELGGYDADGDLCIVANCPPSYKPLLSEGSGRTQVVRMVSLVSSAAAIELKIDPSVVLATRKYADDKAAEVTLAHEQKVNPHPQYLSKVEGDAKIAAAVAALVGGSPEALDTLKELSDALGGDAHFSTTVLNTLAQKADLSGKVGQVFNVGAAANATHAINLGDADARYMLKTGGDRIGEIVVWPYPSAKKNGLLCNGAAVPSAVYTGLFAYAVKTLEGVAISIGSPAVVSWPAHPLYANAPIKFTTKGALPTGIVSGTTYYVMAAGLTANSFQISSVPNGAAIVTTGAQAGVHTAIHAVHGCANDLSTFNLPNIPSGYTTVQAAANEGVATVGQVIAHAHTSFRTAGQGYAGGSGGPPAEFDGYGVTGTTGGTANFAAGLPARYYIMFA